MVVIAVVGAHCPATADKSYDYAYPFRSLTVFGEGRTKITEIRELV